MPPGGKAPIEFSTAAGIASAAGGKPPKTLPHQSQYPQTLRPGTRRSANPGAVTQGKDKPRGGQPGIRICQQETASPCRINPARPGAHRGHPRNRQTPRPRALLTGAYRQSVPRRRHPHPPARGTGTGHTGRPTPRSLPRPADVFRVPGRRLRRGGGFRRSGGRGAACLGKPHAARRAAAGMAAGRRRRGGRHGVRHIFGFFPIMYGWVVPVWQDAHAPGCPRWTGDGQRASTGLAEEVRPSSSSRRDESERRRDASGISADTSSRQPSGTSSRKAAQSGAARSPSTVAGRLRRWWQRWHRWHRRLPLASAGESGAADSSRRGVGLSVPGRRRPPMIRAGRQAAGAKERAAARCFIRVPPSF